VDACSRAEQSQVELSNAPQPSTARQSIALLSGCGRLVAGGTHVIALMTCLMSQSLVFMLAMACSVQISAHQPPSCHCRAGRRAKWGQLSFGFGSCVAGLTTQHMGKHPPARGRE
jgi:hypothetical protein